MAAHFTATEDRDRLLEGLLPKHHNGLQLSPIGVMMIIAFVFEPFRQAYGADSTDVGVRAQWGSM